MSRYFRWLEQADGFFQERKSVIALFCFLAVAQLIIPLSMVVRYALTLQQGVPVKFRVQAVDPYDVFRGRYVRISVSELDSFALTATANSQIEPVRFEPEKTVYAVIGEGPDGFGYIRHVQLTEPADKDVIYLRLPVSHSHPGRLYFDSPFKRFYLEEFDAPRVEKLLLASDAGDLNYVIIRIRHGYGVLDALFIDDKPLRDVLQP